MRLFPHLLVVALLLAAASPQTCSYLAADEDLLQSGSILVTNSFANGIASPIREHVYNVPLTYSPPNGFFQAIASIADQTFTSLASNNLDFSVRAGAAPLPSTATARIVLLISDDNSWTRIRVSYFISSRPDFTLAHWPINAYQMTPSGLNEYTAAQTVDRWTNTQAESVALIEFSGIRTGSNQIITVAFVSTSFNGSSGLLSVTVSVVGSPLPEVLQLAYACWVKSATLPYSSFDPASTYAAYSFVGVEKAVGNQISYLGNGFNRANSLPCNGNKCPSACVGSSSCLAAGGQVVAGSCFLCGADQVYQNANCVPTVSCKLNQVYNGAACVCAANYYPVGSDCLPNCGTNAYVDTNGVCQCLPLGQCLKQITCKVNEVLVNGVCDCAPGYGYVNGTCTAAFSCPIGLIWHGAAHSCVCANLGEFFYNGRCQSCPANSAWNGLTCACLANFYLINGACSTCGANASWNGNACACNLGFNLIGGVCTSCPANSGWNGSQCVCNLGFYFANGQCNSCPANSEWNGNACVCSSGYQQTSSVAPCLPCPANSAWVAASRTCVCNSPFFLNNGACISCAAGTSWDGTQCSSVCPNKSSWNGSQCVCIAGFYDIQGACLPCDPNSRYDALAKTCICNPGFYGNYQLCTACDPSCATCSQSGPSACLSCPSGITLASGTCPVLLACGLGYFKNTAGNCAACSANCQACSDSTNCTICNSGYVVSLLLATTGPYYGCGQIPQGTSSKLALTGTVVANGRIFQGVTLSQLPVSFLIDDCASCSDLLLVKVLAQGVTITTSVSYVLNSQYWFVITFSYPDAGIVPVFQFTVQINPKYAAQFSPADIVQKAYNTINPVTYPVIQPPTIVATGGDIANAPRPGGILGQSGSNARPVAPPASSSAIIASNKELKTTFNGQAISSMFAKK